MNMAKMYSQYITLTNIATVDREDVTIKYTFTFTKYSIQMSCP